VGKKVELNEVLKYYIELEQSKNKNRVINNIDSMDQKCLCEMVKKLSDKRNNEMHGKLCCTTYEWHLCNKKSDCLELSPINACVKPYLDKANRRIEEFSKFVLNKCSKHLTEFEFAEHIKYNRLICLKEKENGTIRIIDGNHRAVALFISRTRNFECYIGYDKPILRK
jgi:hypothetical protein